jgi:hypothetical protein
MTKDAAQRSKWTFYEAVNIAYSPEGIAQEGEKALRAHAPHRQPPTAIDTWLKESYRYCLCNDRVIQLR